MMNRMHQAVDAETLRKIYQHPFNQQLHKGTLSPQVFRHFIIQDALYLRDFSRILQQLSTRLATVNADYAQHFLRFAEDTVKAEQYMQEKYLSKKTSTMHFFQSEVIEKIPAIAAYTNHLLTCAEKEPVPVAVASLVPCFWLYYELGKQMNEAAQDENHPYREWIAEYVSEEFGRSVTTIIQCNNELGENASSDLQAQMIKAFVQSTEFELGFWESVLPTEQKIVELKYETPKPH